MNANHGKSGESEMRDEQPDLFAHREEGEMTKDRLERKRKLLITELKKNENYQRWKKENPNFEQEFEAYKKRVANGRVRI